jgi:fumarate reductase subunit D
MKAVVAASSQVAAVYESVVVTLIVMVVPSGHSAVADLVLVAVRVQSSVGKLLGLTSVPFACAFKEAIPKAVKNKKVLFFIVINLVEIYIHDLTKHLKGSHYKLANKATWILQIKD